MRKALFFTITIFIITTGCKKNQDQKAVQPSQENILSDNAHIVDTTAIIKWDSGSVTLNKNGLSFTPFVGDILLASPSIKDTVGMLVKILSVSNTGAGFICSTTPSNLNEAFRQLFIDHTYSQDYQSSSIYSRGTSLSNFFQHFKAGNLEVNGNLEIHIPQVEIHYHKKNGKLYPDTVRVIASFNTEGSNLEVKSALTQLPEITLKEFKLPTILVPVPVGAVIIPLPFTQKVELKMFPASVSGKLKLDVNPVVHATLGFSFINGHWKNLSDFTIDASATDIQNKKSDFDASLQASFTFLKPVYEIAPMGSKNFEGYFEIPNNLNFNVQAPSPNYSLNYSLNVEAGIKYKFWTGIEGDLSAGVNLIKNTILEGNFKDTIEINFDTVLIKSSNIKSVLINGITFSSRTINNNEYPWTGCFSSDNSNFPYDNNYPQSPQRMFGIVIGDLSSLPPIKKIIARMSYNCSPGRIAVCDSSGNQFWEKFNDDCNNEINETINIGSKKLSKINFSAYEGTPEYLRIEF